MFTGLIQQVGAFSRLEMSRKTGVLWLDAQWDRVELEIGESIAVNGACLSLIRQEGSQLAFNVLQETIRKTALNDKRSGDLLNLERALRMGDPLGGHLVSGHVDGIGTVQSVATDANDIVLTIAAPSLIHDMVPKGSIAIDGISLTLVEVNAASGEFSVHIIPHTWQETALRIIQPGMKVNLETDMLGKFVRAQLDQQKETPRITWERLEQAGFLD